MHAFRNNSCFPSVKIGIIPSKYGVKAGFIPSNHIAKRGIIPFGCFEWAIIRIAITMARQRRMWRNFSPQRFACRATVFYHMGARALSVQADCVVKNIIGLTRTIHAYLRGQMSAWLPKPLSDYSAPTAFVLFSLQGNVFLMIVRIFAITESAALPVWTANQGGYFAF